MIRVKLAGICGTDREILKGYSGFRGIPGHEFVGEVVECDEKRWLGKRVVGEINISCGECNFCLWGLSRHCPRRTVLGIVKHSGAFAEFLTLPVDNLHAVPDVMADEAAVFVEPLAAAAEILEQVHVAPATPVAVLGDGRLGLLVAQVLRRTEAHVTLFGKHASKLGLAGRWGVKGVNVREGKPPARSFRLVVEATGSPSGLEEALRVAEPRGTVVMKSTFRDPARFETAKLVVDEITLVGSRCGNFSTALELLARGEVQVKELVSKVFPLREGLDAFKYLERPGCLKVLLAPS